MIGRKNAGLLPLRGHSNVQGIGSVGFTPKLKQTIFDNLEKQFNVYLPKNKGLDTLSCMDVLRIVGNFNFAWNLGGNLFGSNPDSSFAEKALSKIDFILYMNTTLNQGHFRGRGKTTIVLPVLARDEEPQKTTQESMFSYVRLSDGGKTRHSGPRSEGQIISDIATSIKRKSYQMDRIPTKMETSEKLIGKIIPGFEKIGSIDQTKEEFHIRWTNFTLARFSNSRWTGNFYCVLRYLNCPLKQILTSTFKLMTVRSEGQFNTVVYDKEDRYRGVNSRDIIFMSMPRILIP